MIGAQPESLRRLFVCICILPLVPQIGFAQTSQHRETDLEFINRLTAKADQLSGRVDQMFAATGIQPTGRSTRASSGVNAGVQNAGGSYSTDGSQSRGTNPDGMAGTTGSGRPGAASVTATELNRMSRKLRSITRTLESERDSLSSGESMDEKKRARREKKLNRIDLDLKSMDSELSSMERVMY